MTENSDIMLQNIEGSKDMFVEQTDRSVLNEAEENNVILEDLEKAPLEIERKSLKTSKKNEPWRKIDVRLSDVINSFVENSESPVFLIRDDRVVYLNNSALAMLDFQSDRDVIGRRFFSFVAQEDWSNLAENIGEMLTSGKVVVVNLKNKNGILRKMTFQAVYLSEIEHFSFILVGESPKKENKTTFNNLYDDMTGLPNFFLFEDRVHVAVSLENAKENASDRRMLAVAAININNIDSFYKMHIDEMILKKIAGNLVLNLPKNATVALGLKYHFWVMLVDLKNIEDINRELKKLVASLSEGVRDNLTKHDLDFSVGVSVFPTIANSSKKIIEQALKAVRTAQIKKVPLAFFDPKI